MRVRIEQQAVLAGGRRLPIKFLIGIGARAMKLNGKGKREPAQGGNGGFSSHRERRIGGLNILFHGDRLDL